VEDLPSQLPSVDLNPLKSKSFGFGNLFATFWVFLSSELVSAFSAQRGGLHSFEFADNSSAIRSLRLVFWRGLGNRAGDCLESEPHQP
jgi:hypothetical protein